MSITIVATPGSATANSFVTEVEQIAYMATRLNASAWTSITGTTCTETEKAAMIEATRELSNATWKQTRASTTQALSWPRWFVVNPDIPWAGTVFYDSSIIPQRVKDATCELAFQFLKAGTTDLASQDTLQNVVSKTVGPLSTTYSNPLNRTKGLARFPRVMDLIRPLLVTSGISTPIVRG